MRILHFFTFMVLTLGVAPTARAADHLDSPLVQGDGRLDINDVYAFQSPTNPANVVFVVTVNPAAGVISPTTFAPMGKYQLNIDNNGNARADIVYEFAFTAPAANNSQQFTVRRNNALVARGTTGSNVAIRSAGGGMVRCDLFDDPFYFDLNGFNNGFQFTGSDFFQGFNTSAMVIELPRSTLGGNNLGIWARTEVGGMQFDRKGRPAINTALIPSSLKDAFNIGIPANDVANFRPTVLASVTALSGDANYAAGVTGVLLPDLLTIDTSSNAGFLNGRGLSDDVIDAELNLLTLGVVATDGVNANDKVFSASFPYLAVPH